MRLPFLPYLTLIPLLLLGCSRAPAPAPANPPARLLALEQRVAQLDRAVSNLHVYAQAQHQIVTNRFDTIYGIIGYIHPDLLDPETGLAYGAHPSEYSGAIDPATGLPARDRRRRP